MNTSNLTITQVGNDYLTALRYEYGRSPNTLKAYWAAFRHFQRYLTGVGTPDDIACFTTAVCRAYLYALQGRGLRPRTIRSMFHPIRGMGQYAVDVEILDRNPVASLSMPKMDAAKRLLVSDDEVTALLKATRSLYPERTAALAQALLNTLVFGGVRFQECMDIKLDDVSLSTGSILIPHGKGEKSRTIWPPKECMDTIRGWIALRGDCDHDWLWSRNNTNRMGGPAVRDLLEEVKTLAGLEGKKNIKPHSLRHAFATRLMDNGAPLHTIQAALGHARMTQTQDYVHMSERQAKRMPEFSALNTTDQAPTVSPNNQAPIPPSDKTARPRRRCSAALFNHRKRNGGR